MKVEGPDLGVHATVFMDRHDFAPTDVSSITGQKGLRTVEPDEVEGELVEEIDIVSVWTLWCALYGLQQGTPEAIRRALRCIGLSGDCEDWADEGTLMPRDVPEPPGWSNSIYDPPT